MDRPATAFAALVLPALALVLGTACDKDPGDSANPSPAAAAPSASAAPEPPSAPPDPPRAPEIIVDQSNISVGKDHVPTGDPGAATMLASMFAGRPMIDGHLVDIVAMRNARPSQVESVVHALHSAGATEAGIRTETRDGATVRLRVSFAKSLQDCATVAFIAKDAAIEVWPAGGGRAKRVIPGLAGPDMTLGTDALRAQSSGCSASEVAVGAEDTMTWGLVFDLATAALSAPGARASAVVLLRAATPGRKVVIE